MRPDRRCIALWRRRKGFRPTGQGVSFVHDHRLSSLYRESRLAH